MTPLVRWVFEDYLKPELRSIYHKMMSDRKMVVESASSFGANATT
jgi:hypothetical protein